VADLHDLYIHLVNIPMRKGTGLFVRREQAGFTLGNVDMCVRRGNQWLRRIPSYAFLWQ
jgi:hypothetical protein